jgi:hypothetical protein
MNHLLIEADIVEAKVIDRNGYLWSELIAISIC